MGQIQVWGSLKLVPFGGPFSKVRVIKLQMHNWVLDLEGSCSFKCTSFTADLLWLMEIFLLGLRTLPRQP